jgi:uncharacterized protein
MPIPFDDIPLIDDHAHPLLLPEPASAEPFARYFTEGHDAETVARHAPATLFYRWALRELSTFLGCEPEEQAVVAARAARPMGHYLRDLLADAGVERVLIDDGYPRTGALTVDQMAAAGGVRAGRVLRIERLLEDLIPGRESIFAYRRGLAIERPPAAAAGLALAELQQTWGSEPGRLASKPLLDAVLPAVFDWAGARGLPVQFHTGFGDRDVDLRLANPVLLRPLLEGGALARTRVVLLHTSYPYVREAAYLANVYPNVSVDLSEAAPLLAGPGLTRVLEELLSLAPVTKLLYGSDAWGVPEWFWLAARAARRALAEALAWLPEAEQRWAARCILHDNAVATYHLDA